VRRLNRAGGTRAKGRQKIKLAGGSLTTKEKGVDKRRS